MKTAPCKFLQPKVKGFTLVEAVVVLAVIAILSAVIVPHFIQLQRQARISAIEGAQKAINGARELAKAKYFIAGNMTATIVEMDADAVAVEVGTGIPVASAAGIGKAMDTSRYAVTYSSSPNVATFTLPGGTGTCEASYEDSGAITVTTTGC